MIQLGGTSYARLILSLNLVSPWIWLY